MDLKGFSLLKKSWLLGSILSLQSKPSNLYHSPPDHMQHKVLVATEEHRRSLSLPLPLLGVPQEWEVQPLPGLVSNRGREELLSRSWNCPPGLTV